MAINKARFIDLGFLTAVLVVFLAGLIGCCSLRMSRPPPLLEWVWRVEKSHGGSSRYLAGHFRAPEWLEEEIRNSGMSYVGATLTPDGRWSSGIAGLAYMDDASEAGGVRNCWMEFRYDHDEDVFNAILATGNPWVVLHTRGLFSACVLAKFSVSSDAIRSVIPR
jgi:hypothetical protein